MPELPEVETVARTLRPHVQSCTITNATLLRASSLHPLSLPLSQLTGCHIVDVKRRGKLLKLLLSSSEAQNDLQIVVHLRMTGRLIIKPSNASPGAYTRLFFDLANTNGESRLFFDDVRSFGQVFVCTPDILSQWTFWRTLGPEPLEISEVDFAARLNGKNKCLKALLLDQKCVAGIGNIYADESLFAARLSPLRKASSLSESECACLLQCLQDVLTRSIAQCGSSIRDYCDADGNVGAFQNSFAVYGRGGQPCQHCGRELLKLRVAGRSTVYCPKCQK
ncbi:MAG: bifunctional DNA-formamidopyrimidine glycosylase/DNA-(apurinic or apyrimidinic site) lyase [Desulfovibrionaceae bacterium]|nr:bifunctional DNA-formamidopyrimidine glycosylase/DNA-(apurinic or apyrimidinic site) lyase [Desulfovibrionaceae bacterium]